MGRNIRKYIVFLLVTAALLMLTACGGPPASPDAPMATTTPAASETPDQTPGETPKDSAPEVQTYSIGGVFQADIPTGLEIRESEDKTAIMIQSENWTMYLTATVKESKIGSVLEELEAFVKSNQVFSIEPFAAGSFSGYRYYTADPAAETPHMVSINFDCQTPQGGRQGHVGLENDKNGADVTPLLDDPVVKSILDSIRAAE